MKQSKPPIGSLIFFTVMVVMGGIFALAAVQGSYGIFRRAQIEAEIVALEAERVALRAELGRMENLTHRLSDAYLDVELLDERAREVLGVLRADEIVIR